LAQRLAVFMLVGGTIGFGAVFLGPPGAVIAAVGVAVIVGASRRHPELLLRVGGYLIGAGVVGFSLVGPAVKGSGGGFVYTDPWLLVTAYAAIALAGSAMVVALALARLRGRGRKGSR